MNVFHECASASNWPGASRRLKTLVLQWLPVARNDATGHSQPAPGQSPVKRVLRSKGFIWQSSSHDTAYFWSHAGQHFVIHDEGKWCEMEHHLPKLCSLS